MTENYYYIPAGSIVFKGTTIQISFNSPYGTVNLKKRIYESSVTGHTYTDVPEYKIASTIQIEQFDECVRLGKYAVAPGIGIKDILVGVRTDDNLNIKEGELYRISPISDWKNFTLDNHGNDFSRDNSTSSLRIATLEEIRFFDSGGRNIKDMPTNPDVLERIKKHIPGFFPGCTLRIKDTPNMRAAYNAKYIGATFGSLSDLKAISRLLGTWDSGRETHIIDPENSYCINYKPGDVELVLDINQHGLHVGDKLPEDIINKWCNHGNNYSYKDGWQQTTCGFYGDRNIVNFGVINGEVGFLVSGTSDVYLKAEGFKEFMNNRSLPLPKEDCLKFKVGDIIKTKRGTGKVIFIDITSVPYAVEHDRHISGHSCDGKGERGYCWYYAEEELWHYSEQEDREPFPIGTRVQLNDSIETGTIIGRSERNYCIECDNPIGPHDGKGIKDSDTGKGIRGKQYHCIYANPITFTIILGRASSSQSQTKKGFDEEAYKQKEFNQILKIKNKHGRTKKLGTKNPISLDWRR